MRIELISEDICNCAAVMSEYETSVLTGEILV
jgi:hypothetical protein